MTVHWVQKQVEALAKQDCFWRWSASKIMNAYCHTRGQTGHKSMLEVKTFTASTIPPPPRIDTSRSQSMSADCKITDCSISGWVKQSGKSRTANCMTFPLYFHSISNCISMRGGGGGGGGGSHPLLMELSVLLFASNEETLEIAEKTTSSCY